MQSSLRNFEACIRRNVHEQFTFAKPASLLCFSHLRWNFVYQRPQHLLSRCQKVCDVHFWEEPEHVAAQSADLRVETDPTGLRVLTPLLPQGVDRLASVVLQRELLDGYIKREQIGRYISWYYTPMALDFTSHLTPCLTVYDCMDELSNFKGAPPNLVRMEATLFARADVVFAGGASLYESKRQQHQNVHLFPSSIDREHFSRARAHLADPADQNGIPHPRIGFFGVLDERLDRDLLAAIAQQNPDWQLILLGPLAKIDPEDLPRAENIHYLGRKAYAELPDYLANWEVAILPFAQNPSTKFISPTKTPEYLAAGKPVVSTPIQDVVRPYGELGLVEIAADAEAFSQAIETCLQRDDPNWLSAVDRFLDGMSWDRTFQLMWAQLQISMQQKRLSTTLIQTSERSEPYV
jgi:UDP-galactopyranose mutase